MIKNTIFAKLNQADHYLVRAYVIFVVCGIAAILVVSFQYKAVHEAQQQNQKALKLALGQNEEILKLFRKSATSNHSETLAILDDIATKLGVDVGNSRQ